MTAAIDKKYEDQILATIPLGALRCPARCDTAVDGWPSLLPPTAELCFLIGRASEH